MLKSAIILNIMFLVGYMRYQVQCENQEMESRVPRLMQLLGEPKVQFGQLKRPGPNPGHLPHVRARNDNLPLPHLIAHKEYGHEPALRPPPPPAGPHIMRREYNAAPVQHQQNGYHYDFSKLTRFAHAKDAPVLDVAKNQFFRPEGNQHHNTVYKYPSEQYIHNFKASPQFNGNVIHKDHQFGAPLYTPIQQHAIPVQAPQFTQGPKFYGESNSYTVIPSKQTQKGLENYGYLVHEESDSASKENAAQGKNYHQIPTNPVVSKEAQDYLHFMSTNEYFLPKHEPNYKKLDAENQQKFYEQQKQAAHVLEQQRPHQHFLNPAPNVRHQLDNSVSSTYNKPIQVQDLFYQQDPNPSNAAVVRGSYQTGQDVFVVKSDGNKAVKHVVSTPLATQTSTQSVAASSYNQERRTRYQTNTPEPLRFEFTEKDAISGGATSFTHSPQGQKYFYETSPNILTSTPRPTTLSDATLTEVAKPIKEYTNEADPEDSADVNQRPNEEISLQTTNGSVGTANSKDTESYCEKICANVYDENDEIICGSDGYMYTGEPQLECYSSCLNISVTIKSKGSCI